MRNLIVALLAGNVALILFNLFVYFRATDEIPLTIEGIPALTVQAEIPGNAYSAGKADGASSCYTIGPYYSEKAAQLLAGNIRSYGLEVTIRGMNSKDTLNYLVFIPKAPNKETAITITEDLKAHQVDKFSIVKTGPYKNSITFGFYEDLDKAKRQTEYIRYLGYDARYNEQKVMRKVYWVDYDEPLGTDTPALDWSKTIDPSSNVQVIPRNCDQRTWYSSGAFADSAGVLEN